MTSSKIKSPINMNPYIPHSGQLSYDMISEEPAHPVNSTNSKALQKIQQSEQAIQSRLSDLIYQAPRPSE
jgi:hypothetical protein